VPCLKSLAGHDIEVGKFYYRAKKYKAALRRFKNVITKYPDVGVHKNALQYIALTEAKLKAQQGEKQNN
jgi:outer membrane protein assembly factor BamD